MISPLERSRIGSRFSGRTMISNPGLLRAAAAPISVAASHLNLHPHPVEDEHGNDASNPSAEDKECLSNGLVWDVDDEVHARGYSLFDAKDFEPLRVAVFADSLTGQCRRMFASFAGTEFLKLHVIPTQPEGQCSYQYPGARHRGIFNR